MLGKEKYTKYSKELWEILFNEYYHDEIIDLARAFPKQQNLVVSYDWLTNCWGARVEDPTEATDFLIRSPDEVLKDANEALHGLQLSIPAPEGWQKAGVEISGFKPEIAIRDIRHEHLNTFVSATGTVLRKTDVKFNIIRAVYKCQRCGHMNSVEQQIDGPLIEPFECESESCGRKGPFKLLYEESEWVNKRKIRIQETFDQITEGEQTLSALDAILLGNVECPPLGSTITASGVLKPVQTVYSGQKLPDFYPVMSINHIDVHDAEKTLVITDEDIKEMKKLAQDENIIQKLVASTAPSIKGYEAIKEACLCSTVSPDNFPLPDGRELRGHSHIMICGDPSTGKTMIMKAVQNLVPRAQYAAGRGASAKGLTVSVTRDRWSEGAWVAEAGMLVLADRALALIDEMDKYEPEEQQELNSALELGRIPINKAGINREFYARCPVIGGLNPKYGRFDRFEQILKQVNVPPDTLSRYDLVFIIYDAPKEGDRKIAKHILNLWVKASKKYAHRSDVKEMLAGWGRDEYAPEISIEMMRKWIAHAKTISVEVTPECAAVIEDFFMTIRMQGEEGRVPIVFRNLDGMVRLLIAETRLRHGNKTEMRDVQRVMALATESFQAIVDPTTGKMDSDIISTGTSKSMRDRIKALIEIIRELQGEYGSAVPLEDIAAKAEESGIKKETVEDMIQKLKTAGEVYELSHGKYKVA